MFITKTVQIDVPNNYKRDLIELLQFTAYYNKGEKCGIVKMCPRDKNNLIVDVDISEEIVDEYPIEFYFESVKNQLYGSSYRNRYGTKQTPQFDIKEIQKDLKIDSSDEYSDVIISFSRLLKMKDSESKEKIQKIMEILNTHPDNELKEKKIIWVDIEKLLPNDSNLKSFSKEDVNELAESIIENGMLEPILVYDRKSFYQIITGDRRYKAAQKAGLTKVPILICEDERKTERRLKTLEK